MKVCKIPERTAYRYISTLSEFGVPIHFDANKGGYHLVGRKHVPIDTFGPTDAVLILIGLGLLSSQVNAEYRADINRLLKNLAAWQDYALDDVLSSVEHLFEPRQGIDDYSELLSICLINAGIGSGHNIKILKNDNDDAVTLSHGEIKLSFENGWNLAGRSQLEDAGVTISDVRKVILRTARREHKHKRSSIA